MEHHILARFAQVILVLYASIVASPIFGCFVTYFFILGWFNNQDENDKYKLPWKPKMLFNFAMGNIVLQLIIGSIFIGFSWGIFLMMIFLLGLYFGIFSSKDHIEEAQKLYRKLDSLYFRKIGRVW